MGLNFVGETGVYLPKKDVIKFVAVDGARAIDCVVNRSALDAIGCGRALGIADMIRQFEKHRIEIEVAAMIKYRRLLSVVTAVDVGVEDLRKVAPPTAA
jgi:hypothetical protein